jgi:superfamily II RNA helicase
VTEADSYRLDLTIPETGFADSDQAMEAFIGWTEAQGLTLYSHQEEAILEIFSGNHLIINTPTGSGKSLIATAMIFKCFAECGVAYMTAPIKALVSEKFFSLCRIFGAKNVGMMTGDGAVNREAPIVICTAEILSNLSLREGEDAKVNAVIMDEFHYYGDRDRGMAWQLPLLTLPQARFVLMSATLGDTSAISDRLKQRTGCEVALIESAQRPVPLSFEWSEQAIHDVIQDLVFKNRTPVYVVHFSQREATERAQAMLSLGVADKEQKVAIKQALKGVRFDSTFGKHMRRYLEHGVGLHHGGLLPRYRTAVEQLAQKGLLTVICGTDTLGVGINVPIRTVLFTRLSKYDGRKQRLLTVRDFHQIAGRAGRAGYDTEGLVVAQAPEHVIENKTLRAKAAASGKKKVKLKKAPEKGFVHYDEALFQQLIARAPEELKSRFRLDHGTLLTLLQNAETRRGDAGQGLEMLERLVELAHLSNNGRERVRTRTTELLSELVQAGVVGWLPSPDDANRKLALDDGLQEDFSLHHSLSLFLVETMVQLKRDDPEFVLNAITLTEAVLEDPMVVLYALRNKAKSIAITKMKVDGIPYEERMEALEDISWPQPKREWLHQTFDAYAAGHPWVLGRELHPKSIVRAMFGEYRSFNGWVKEFQLERSEGVLLRYLSEAYKALVQNIPADDRTEELWAAIAWLRSVVHRADSSLVEEWERMALGTEATKEEIPQGVDISADSRAFQARIRAELHGFLRALADEDYEEALLLVRPLEGAPAWSAHRLETALAPYREQYGGITFNHSARMSEHTVIQLEEPHRWRVIQTLIDEPPEPQYELEEPAEPDNCTFLHCVVDLRQDTHPVGPVLTVLKVAGAFVAPSFCGG